VLTERTEVEVEDIYTEASETSNKYKRLSKEVYLGFSMYKDINVKFLLELHNTVNFCLDCLFILFLRDPGKIRKRSRFQ
jgi:hypothetical protein